MAIDNFIPQIWSARVEAQIKAALVYGQPAIVNRNYEGEIKGPGDTVRINTIGSVSVGRYTRYTDISAAEQIWDVSQVLTIDQEMYFNFKVDDVDRLQAMGNVMDAALAEASYALAFEADKYLANLMTTNVATKNVIGSIASPKAVGFDSGDTNPYNLLVDLSVKLNESNVPMQGRWVVVPPWFHGQLLKDERFVSFGTGENTTRLLNGTVGQAAGFTIMISNTVPREADGSAYRILCGNNTATTFAEQINKVEAYRIQQQFGDAVKGLHIYGAKVLRPDQLALVYASAS